MSNRLPFEPEDPIESESITEDITEEKSEEDIIEEKAEPEIDTKEYGMAKPKRLIIRAKISND